MALRTRRRRPQQKVVTSPCLHTVTSNNVLISSQTNVDTRLEAFEVVLFLISEIEEHELSSSNWSGLRPGRGTSKTCLLENL